MPIGQAITADLTARALRPLTDTETRWGGVRLRDAFTQIVATLPTVAVRLETAAPNSPLPQLVVQIQCAMVLRVLANPESVLEETIDDYTRRLDAAVSTGALYLTDQERALLSSSVGSSEGAFTIRPSGYRDNAGGWFPTTTTDTW